MASGEAGGGELVTSLYFSSKEWLRIGLVIKELRPDVSVFDCNIRILEKIQNDQSWERCLKKRGMPAFVPVHVITASEKIEFEDVKMRPIYFDENRRGVWFGYCELNNEILIRST